MKNPTVLTIVTDYLKDNGYDGLYTEGCDCLLGDLCPCGCGSLDCRAGHKGPCDCRSDLYHEDIRFDQIDVLGESGDRPDEGLICRYERHVGPDKPAEKPAESDERA